jgi:aspartate/methionine/tyrosine aminotransferase
VRGGYFEYRNVPADVAAQILKLQSVCLCSNLAGQVATYAMVHPPKPGDPSYELYNHEKTGILEELRLRAALLAEGLNKIDGISCNAIDGAMYAFPSILLPSGVTDEEYCMALLEETGICVVPGSGFGQVAGTAHFRTTILPPTEKIRQVVEKLRRVLCACEALILTKMKKRERGGLLSLALSLSLFPPSHPSTQSSSPAV